MQFIHLGDGIFTTVDNDTYALLGHLDWRYKPSRGNTHLYAVTGEWPDTRYLHREIMQCPQGLVVDHIDRDPLNNQRANLRVCTRSENNANTRRYNKHGYKGISHLYGAFYACVRKGGKRWQYGPFETPEQAARAYDTAAKKVFGDFAALNFPDG